MDNPVSLPDGRSRRVIVISDLHIGGKVHPMLGHPQLLIDFLGCLARYSPRGEEQPELVINGDLIDFLAEPPNTAWCVDQSSAVAKFDEITKRNAAIFDAFALCLSSGWQCTILLGNHDIELAYPGVRDRLLRRLGTSPRRCLFVAGNEAYRIGDLLIEHGNRYDPWNAIDHNGLRETASALSRGEAPPAELRVCPGSQLVEHIINPLKERYHFIDLLQPVDKLVLLLLTTLEPKLKRDLAKIFAFGRHWVAQTYHAAVWKTFCSGAQPSERHLVSSEAEDDPVPLPPDVIDAFGDELGDDAAGRIEASVGDWSLRRLLWDPQDSLKAKLERGETIGSERLHKLQVALRHRLKNDQSFVEADQSGPEAAGATQMLKARVAKVVVMGHTHLRRSFDVAGGRYINCGTWADVLRLNATLLHANDKARQGLMEWLRALAFDQLENIRVCEPAYADVRIAATGQIDGEPLLRQYHEGASLT